MRKNRIDALYDSYFGPEAMAEAAKTITEAVVRRVLEQPTPPPRARERSE